MASLLAVNRSAVLLISMNVMRQKPSGWVSEKRLLSLKAIKSSRIIPLSSKTLFKRLAAENENNGESLKLFEKFAAGVNGVLTKQNTAVLPELKLLYDPINPDVSTKAVQIFQKRELLDREFWFLQIFSSHLINAGFQELEAKYLRKSFVMKPVGQGVLANLEPESFDVLRCWVLGDFDNESALSWIPTTKNWGFFLEESSDMIFKRVVIASRSKGTYKLSLKLFKDIPYKQLNLLLPPYGGLKMNDTYCKLLYVTSGLSAFFLLSRYVVAWLVGNSHHLDYLPIGFSAFFGMASIILWTNFKQRQKRYLCDVLEVFSNRCVAGNQNLLAIVSDNVQEEMLKGILITYFFMVPYEKKAESAPGQQGIQVKDLEKIINRWSESQTMQQINFDVHDSLAWLSKMGLIEINSQTGEIHPLPLSLALKVLPVSHDFLLPVRVEEFDLFYGNIPDATFLENQDFLDKVTFAVRKQLSKFKRN